MKLFQMHAEFLLSDDFEGDVPDALEAMAAYWRSKEANERAKTGEPGSGFSDKSLTVHEMETQMLEQLLDVNAKDGSRLAFAHAIDLNWNT